MDRRIRSTLVVRAVPATNGPDQRAMVLDEPFVASAVTIALIFLEQLVGHSHPARKRLRIREARNASSLHHPN
jgi:hypothetical protein